MPPALIGLAFHDGARPQHIPYSSYYDLTTPNHALAEWRIVVQGSQLLLVSPPGWAPGFGAKQPTKDGPCTIVQIPRVRCDLYWSGTAEDVGQLDKGQWPAAPPKAEGKGKP